MDKFKVGFIGYGRRGPGVFASILKIEDVEIVAVCDVFKERAEKAAEKAKMEKGYTPIVTTNYKDLIDMKVDAIINTAPWADHNDIAIESMNAGIPIGFEVGGAYSIEECWELVKTQERTGVPCMMLENVCFMRKEMAVMNMVRQGVFGKVVHCDGGYCHDLRESMVRTHDNNHHYRLTNYMIRNSDCYPTHALGPILKILDINNGNKMVSLSSVASCAEGLREEIRTRNGREHHLADYEFQQGDIVTTTIKCARGETITLRLDTTLPRAYSRRFEVHGTKGMFMEDGNLVYLQDEHWDLRESAGKLYNNADGYVEKYEHPLWQKNNKDAANQTEDMLNTGHGGSDDILCRAFIDSVRNNLPMPIDIYDTAIMMSITALSEESIAKGGAPVMVPDFTRGKYLTRKAITEKENNWSI